VRHNVQLLAALHSQVEASHGGRAFASSALPQSAGVVHSAVFTTTGNQCHWQRVCNPLRWWVVPAGFSVCKGMCRCTSQCWPMLPVHRAHGRARMLQLWLLLS